MTPVAVAGLPVVMFLPVPLAHTGVAPEPLLLSEVVGKSPESRQMNGF